MSVLAAKKILANIQSKPELTVQCSVQGNAAEYKLIYNRTAKRSRGDRKQVKDFSPRARLAMLKHFHRIDFEHYVRPLFITLTYPDEWAQPTYDQRITHRKIFARKLEKLTGRTVPAAWRLEWMPRKSGKLIGIPCPHWHLLVFRHTFIPYEEINLAWRQTIHCWNHYCRTEIKRCWDETGIQEYIAKYVSKEALPLSLVIPTIQDRLGNQCGWLRKKEIPTYPVKHYGPLTEAQRRLITSIAAETLYWLPEGIEESYTLFGAAARDARKICEGKPLTSK